MADDEYNNNVSEKLEQDQQRVLTVGIDTINEKIAKRVNGNLKFYDGVTHLGLFGIPKDLRQRIVDEDRIMTLDNPVFMH